MPKHTPSSLRGLAQTLESYAASRCLGTDFRMALMDAAAALLRSEPVGEPVAWRYRYVGSDGIMSPWWIEDHEVSQAANVLARHGLTVECETLFPRAAPPAAPEAQEPERGTCACYGNDGDMCTTHAVPTVSAAGDAHTERGELAAAIAKVLHHTNEVPFDMAVSQAYGLLDATRYGRTNSAAGREEPNA